MAWIYLELPAAELLLKADGWIEWNATLQSRLGDPAWVEIMWDAPTRQLGIRSMKIVHGIPVVTDPESLEYKANAADVLALAGITPVNVSGEPQICVESPVVAGEGWVGHGTIYYLTLP